MPVEETLEFSEYATTPICGLTYTSVGVEELAEHVLKRAKEGNGGWILAVNLDILSRTVRDPEFLDLLSKADVTVTDGMPIVWAIRKKNQAARNHVRTTGSDLTHLLMERAPGSWVGIIGGQDPKRAVLNLGKKLEDYEIFDGKVELTDEFVRRLVAQFAGRKIVFAALGVPKQEKLIRMMQPLMPETVFIGVGASFEFLAGIVPRAPVWMQRSGLEWLYRLGKEPRRLWRRYIVEGPTGVVALWKDVRSSRRADRVSG